MSQSTVALPLCSSCNRPVKPGERATKFYCPDCHEVLMWRGEERRKLFAREKVVHHGLEGPEDVTPGAI